MNVNPMALIQMIKGGKNPQQLLMNILKNQNGNNPILNNAVNMAQNGNMSGLEMIARNLAAQRGFDPKGQPCRFVGDERELVFENRHVIRNQNRAKPVIVNGIKYKSCKEASEKLNIPKTTLYSYLQGKRKNPNYICVYDNQQPS